MIDLIKNRIMEMFDAPVIQNNLRAIWVEAMVGELLGERWRYTGADWAGWDFERDDGIRVEVKQSAARQTWGLATSSPSFGIKAAAGHYPDGINYVENVSGDRLADIYIFAWHDGADQRIAEQWQFFVLASKILPRGQVSIGLAAVRRLVDPITANQLKTAI